MAITRRLFAGSLGAFVCAPTIALGSVKRTFKIGLVGCGGRGTNAVKDIQTAAACLGCEAKLVAAADFFLAKARKLVQRYGADEKCAFGGATGYQKVLASDAEIVLLCTPPFFRSRHTEMAVAAGKHVFAEKPVATDPVGLRRFLKAVVVAQKQGTAILAGTQKRHNSVYQAQYDAVKAGAIGQIVGAQVIRYQNPVWVRPREAGQSNAAYLCNNWYHFWQMSGDFLTEQCIHEVDVANWFLNAYPKNAIGTGGRWCRPAGIGNIYDSFSIDYDYGDDLHLETLVRHLAGGSSRVGTFFTGTEGRLFASGKFKRYDKKPVKEDLARYESRCTQKNAQVLEHFDALKDLMEGRIVNDGERVALTTATTMMGTFAAYSGQTVRMNDLLTNEKSPFYNGWNASFKPEDFEATEDIPVPAEGQGPIPRNLSEYGRG